MLVQPSEGFVLGEPPVVETALSIQFSELPNWKSVHHGLYFLEVKERYPEYEERDVFPAIIESFPIVPRVQKLQLSTKVRRRAEFAARDETSLISIQSDRFSFHWKQAIDDSYPRYATNSAVCKNELESFVRFCKTNNIGEVKPVLCEAMYLNQIKPRPGETIGQLCESVFQMKLGDFEVCTANRTYVLEENLGRLYAEINTSVGDDPHLALKLSARVRHVDGTAMDTLDRAHDWLIEKFRELTSDQARKERWQQND